MAFEKGKAKTGGRKAGSRNKINMFDLETIEAAKQVIANQVQAGDFEAAKLVLNYSLAKPSPYEIGIKAELSDLCNTNAIERIESLG
jgi:hypothetical protein